MGQKALIHPSVADTGAKGRDDCVRNRPLVRLFIVGGPLFLPEFRPPEGVLLPPPVGGIIIDPSASRPWDQADGEGAQVVECAMFETEFKFFLEHQEELVREHRGKTLLIKGEEVVGVFDSPLAAYLEGQKRFKPGTFMVQDCVPGPAAYTAVMQPILTHG